MARRRYVSTTISTDSAVNKLAMQGSDFAALLYTWMIPHAADDASICGEPEELLMIVCPGRRDKTAEDIETALRWMVDFGLVEWDGKTVKFPASAFYRHQSYIKDGERRGTNNSANQRNPNDDSANQRKSAQNDASFSFKSSFSSSVKPSGGERPPNPPRGRRRSVEESPEFVTFYDAYPRHQARDDAWRAWSKLSPGDELVAEIMAGLSALLPEYRARPPDKVPLPATFLNGGRWRDTPTPIGPFGAVDPDEAIRAWKLNGAEAPKPIRPLARGVAS